MWLLTNLFYSSDWRYVQDVGRQHRSAEALHRLRSRRYHCPLVGFRVWGSGCSSPNIFCSTLSFTSLAAGQHCGLRLPRVLLDQGAGEHGEERRHAVAHLLGGLRSILCGRVLRRLHCWMGWFWIVLCLKLSSTNSSRCLSTGSRNAFSLSGAWLPSRPTALTWSTPSETFIKILLFPHLSSFWPGWSYHSSLSTRATSTELSPRLR